MLPISKQLGRTREFSKATDAILLESRRFSHNIRTPAYGEFEDKAHAKEFAWCTTALTGRFVHLNRPHALNALDHKTVQWLLPRLKIWEDEPHAQAILLKGCGGKAFCAGGDIRSLYDNGLKARQGDAKAKANWVNFFEDEYRLNFMTSQMMTPYIPFMNGITMGGGVGLSVHSKYSIATENTLFAMPETAIGFFPDVGGSHFLSRLHHQVGMYLALTGARLKGADVVHAGIAKNFAYSFDYNALHNLLIDGHDKYAYTQNAIDYISVPVENLPAYTLEPHLEVIERIFSLNSVEAIMEALEKENTPFTTKALDMMKMASPLSLKITFKQVRAGAKLDLLDCLAMEFILSQNMLHNDDFYTGVHNTLISKKRGERPQWKHSSVHDVSDAEVDSYFVLPEDGRPFEPGPGVTVRGRGWRRLLNKKFEDPFRFSHLGVRNPVYGSADVMNRVSGSEELVGDISFASQAAYWRFIFSNERFPGSVEYYEQETKKIRSLFGYLDDIATRTTALNIHKRVRDKDLKAIAENAIITPSLREALTIADRDLTVRPVDVLLCVKSWKHTATPELIKSYSLTPEQLKTVFHDLLSSTITPIRMVELAWLNILMKLSPNTEITEERKNILLIATAKAREMVTNKLAFPPTPFFITNDDTVTNSIDAKRSKLQGKIYDIFNPLTLATMDIDLFYTLISNIDYSDSLIVNAEGRYTSALRESNLYQASQGKFKDSLDKVLSNINITRDELVSEFTEWLEQDATTLNVAPILLPNMSNSVSAELLRLNKPGDFADAPLGSQAREELNRIVIQQYRDAALDFNVSEDIATEFAEWFVSRNQIDPSYEEQVKAIDVQGNLIESWLLDMEKKSSQELYDELKSIAPEEDLSEIDTSRFATEKPIGYVGDDKENGAPLYPTISYFKEQALNLVKDLHTETRRLDCDDIISVPKTEEELEEMNSGNFWNYIGAFQNFIHEPSFIQDFIFDQTVEYVEEGQTPSPTDVAYRMMPPAYVRRANFAKKHNIPFQVPLNDD